jgi:hypothetical protein
MPIVGGLDIHRKQITFDYLDTVTGEVKRGQIAPADRAHVRAWLARFDGRDDAGFAVEGCAGWRYVAEELAAAGIAAHLGEPADTAALRGRKRHAKTDLLTELSDVSAAHARCASHQPVIKMSERSGSPGYCSLAASPIATETGHTPLNRSAAFSSLPILDVSRSASRAVLQRP